MRLPLWIVCVGLVAGPARADLTLHYRVTTAGDPSRPALEEEQIRMLKGPRARQDEIEKSPTGDRRHVVLTLLDAGVLDRLDMERKLFDEMPLREMAIPSHDGESASRDASRAVSVDGPRIVKARFKIKPSHEKRVMQGYACRRYDGEMTLDLQDRGSGRRSRSRMTLTLWTSDAPELIQAQSEEQAFSRALLSTMGRATDSVEPASLVRTMAAQFSGASQDELRDVMREASEQMRKVKGYPVVTTINWAATPRIDAAAPVGSSFSFTSELLKATRQSLDEALFRVPADFKRAAL